jgi:hypothetical protein
MTALAQLAAFDTLDAPTIDRLLSQHLVETFAAHAVPDEPVDLEVAFDDDGMVLSWRDPGAATFHAASEFHWSVWVHERVVAAGVSRVPNARADYAIDGVSYALRVYAANECPGGDRLESASAVTA